MQRFGYNTENQNNNRRIYYLEEMNKKAFLAAAMALMSVAATAQEIKVYDTGRKWSQSFDALIKGNSVKRIGARGLQTVTPDSTLCLSVTTAVGMADAVAEFITAEGYHAETAGDQFVMANIPAHFIPTLAAEEGVLYINQSRQARPLMNHVRTETGVAKVQAGTGLDTPYDGTGVIIGVIDQGFEFKHIAFTGRSKRWGSSQSSGGLRTSAPTSDPNDQVGHATHVANIAMGNKIDGSDYYGIATGAELLPMMSNFDNAVVPVQFAAIQKYAAQEGKPFVVNMSFGTNLGPHDGTSAFDQTIEKLLGKGAIAVGAMGNSGGDRIHASYTFTADDEKAYFYLKPDANNKDGIALTQAWGTDTDGKEDLSLKPVIIYNNKVYYPTDEQLSANYNYEKGINPYNNRQFCTLGIQINDLAKKVIGKTSVSGAILCWEITGKTGKTVHVWSDTDSYLCTFERVQRSIINDDDTRTTITSIQGDDNYIVGEAGASVPSSIAVASYNAATNFIATNGSSYSFAQSIGETGDLSKFSSKGPSLSAIDPNKPTVAAPGGCIASAFSKKSKEFASLASTRVQEVTSDGNTFYYGVMNGTSMACPVVTGIVALWLQANPDLTPADVKTIIKKTARHDSYTGRNTEWNNSWGYGKIDAYNGLKEAILMRTAINETYNTAAPITMQKDDDSWKVLFNNDESYADLRIVSMNGQVVESRHITAPRHGDEQVISLQGMAPGVYLFQVSTTASNLTRKMVVK